MKSTLFYFLLFFFYCTLLSGQDCDELADNLFWNFELVGPTEAGDTFYIECNVSDFQNVLAFQYTIQYESEKIEFVEHDDSGNELIGSVSINADSENGVIGLIWTNGNGMPQTITDGGIYKLFFQVIENPSTCFDWDINSVFTDVEIVFELDDNFICTSNSINFDFTPECDECPELTAFVSDCFETMEFYVCGGVEPYTYELNGANGTITNGTITSMDSVRVNDLVGGIYTLIIEDASGQTIPTEDTSFEIFNLNNEVTVIPEQTVCNDVGTLFPTVLDLDQFITTFRSYSIIDPDGETLNSTVVSFIGKETGFHEYNFIVEGPYPCDDEVYPILIYVLDCACPIIGLTEIEDFCLGEGADFNDYLLPGTEAGSFYFLNFQGDTILLDNDNSPLTQLGMGTSTIFYQLDTLLEGCESIVEAEVNIFQPVNLNLTQNFISVCNSDTLGNNTLIDLETITNGASGFWTAPGELILEEQMLDFNGADIGTFDFYFTTDNAVPPCENVSQILTVEVIDCIPSSTLIANKDQFTIYPNPSKGIFNLEIEFAADASIYDLNGRSVKEFSLSQGQNKVNLDELNSGLYLLMISKEGRIMGTEKLVLE